MDEIQHVDNFPDVVDSLFIKKNLDIYLTGSNAYMLSSEIATLISGRYVEIFMLPLSFREYVQSTGDVSNLASKYNEYLSFSSFPYALELRDTPKELNDYLNGIYSTIVLKDVVSRKKVSDPMMLESVVRFTFDNIGILLSTKKIADTMASDGRKIDVKTVEKYLEALMESFVIYRAKRYNIKGEQYLKSLDKYYVVDMVSVGCCWGPNLLMWDIFWRTLFIWSFCVEAMKSMWVNGMSWRWILWLWIRKVKLTFKWQLQSEMPPLCKGNLYHCSIYPIIILS